MVTAFWGEVIQLAGLIFLVIGIGVEIYYEADIGFITVTIGSLLYAVGTKFKHRKEPQNDKWRNAFRRIDW